MPGDDDIARLLPEPPPPRAARRDAAIEAAMRRFDGEVAAPVVRPARAPVWARVGRTQVAAFASVALVAVVGIPLALTVLEREQRAAAPPAVPVAVAQKSAPVAAAPAAKAPPPASVITRFSASITVSRGYEPEPVIAPAPVIVPQDCGKGDCERPEAPPPPDGFFASKVLPEPVPNQEVAVTGRRSAPQAMASAPAPAPAPAPPTAGYGRMADSSDERSIVVTGSRISRANAVATQRRGDWNACTVNDPGKTLAGCRRLIDPGARGAPGQAAAHVADGLSRAWSGDLDGAIGEFDAAIALQPRLAIAYLNRGLAYQRQGENERALADLNRAVRYAPSAARGYFSRSQLLDQTGDAVRARADADKAVEIDPGYRAALE